jgi:glyoxylase I family protein
VPLLGVHHVSINVQDVDQGVTFYTDVLGLTLRNDRPNFGFGGAWLNAGDQQLHLIEAPTPSNLGQHFALQIDGLDGFIDSVRQKGYEVTEPVDVGKNRQAFVNDPFDNCIELHEVGTARS